MSYSRNKRKKINREAQQLKLLQKQIANAIIKTLEDMDNAKESKTE